VVYTYRNGSIFDSNNKAIYNYRNGYVLNKGK
jgi:hypothetical protein